MSTAVEAAPLRIGDVAPDFTADSTKGKIEFHKWADKSWVVFCSHPQDFTPECTTELGDVARKGPEWAKRGVKVLALSVDSVDDHKKWIPDINETQKTEVDYPILGGASARETARLYGMIHPNASDTFTVRTVFFIDPNKKVRAMITYPAAAGRNFDEILRLVDALQLTDRASVATPVNWKKGEDCIVLPSLSDEDAKKKFPKGFKTLRPYLRITPQP
ncbi:MAG TPA: peroxiredoxin [Elusimicrobiota bacterium]|nr:peroxiredoxin [Elusimicrobiota bacterium]